MHSPGGAERYALHLYKSGVKAHLLTLMYPVKKKVWKVSFQVRWTTISKVRYHIGGRFSLLEV